MTLKQMCEEYRASFEGSVFRSELDPLSEEWCEAGAWCKLFVCPCGETNHAATVHIEYRQEKRSNVRSVLLSNVLHCWENNR